MNTAKIALLSARIKAYIGYDINCSVDEEEGLFIVEVFAVPDEYRKDVRYSLYDLDKILFPDGDFAISVIPYSIGDTKQYFPDVWARINQKRCLDASGVKYENDGCSNSTPVDPCIYLAA